MRSPTMDPRSALQRIFPWAGARNPGALVPTAGSGGTGSANVLRLLTIVAALVVLYIRMPTTFSAPQFWAEDCDFFYVSRALGWTSFSTVMGGYYVWAQFVVAVLASYVSPVIVPAVYAYTAAAVTLSVVALVCSPRLPLPNRPLLALAVVVVPMGYEELGTLANIQWVLPIGALAILLMRAHASRLVLAAECLFVFLTAFSGPFSIFLTPLFLWRALSARERVERVRFVMLTVPVCVGAVVQLRVILDNPTILNLVAPSSYPWTVWVNLPFTQVMTVFGPVSELFKGTTGAILGLVLLGTALISLFFGSCRQQRLLMLLLASAITLAGMYKFRAALETQFSSQRYFYMASVVALWFLCCLSTRRFLRTGLAALVAIIELSLVPAVAQTPRPGEVNQWPVWARYLDSGLAITIPTTPPTFYLNFPPSASGPYAQFRSWLGRPIGDVATLTEPSACSGGLASIRQLQTIYIEPIQWPSALWSTDGTAWDTARDRPVQLVALADEGGKVVGFGFPGFEQSETASRPGAGWRAVFYADGHTSLKAYGILENGARACPLDDRQYFPIVTQPLASDQFVGAAEILPGREMVQRFVPSQPLVRLSVKFVTWARTPSAYTIKWRVTASENAGELQLGAGKIESRTVTDWQVLELPLSVVPQDVPKEVTVRFTTDATSPPAPIGIPLYRPAPGNTAPAAEVGGGLPTPGAQIGLSLIYGR